MASEQTATVKRQTDQFPWRGGALAGLAAGVVMGAMLTTQMTPVIEVAIPALYGLDGIAAGWAAHLFHSVVLGIVFAGVATSVGDVSVGKSAVLGAAYGVVLWVLLAAVVMPVWLGAVGFPNAPALPNFNPQSLVGHVVYGLVVGVAFPYVRDL